MILTFNENEHNLFVSIYSAFFITKKPMANIADMNNALEIHKKFKAVSIPLQEENLTTPLLQPNAPDVSIDLTEEELNYLKEAILPPNVEWKNTHLELLIQIQSKLNVVEDTKIVQKGPLHVIK